MLFTIHLIVLFWYIFLYHCSWASCNDQNFASLCFTSHHKIDSKISWHFLLIIWQPILYIDEAFIDSIIKLTQLAQHIDAQYLTNSKIFFFLKLFKALLSTRFVGLQMSLCVFIFLNITVSYYCTITGVGPTVDLHFHCFYFVKYPWRDY